jgi:bacterial/archaeal transporter family-2 protein
MLGTVRRQNPRVFASLLAGCFGIGMALEARINGELSAHVGTGIFPAWLETITALLLASLLVAIHLPTRHALLKIKREVSTGSLPAFTLVGGVFGAIFLTTQSVTVPIVGVAVFAVGVIAGQTTGSLIIDRLGIGASGIYLITWQRATAGVLAVLAVVMGIANQFQSVGGIVWGALFAFIAGFLVAPQQAINGRVAIAGRSPFALAFVNFLGGAIVMTAVSLCGLLFANLRFNDVWGAPWWAYTGGLFGFLLVSAAAWVVPILGVFLFTLISVFGSIGSALLFDLLLPINGNEVGWNLLMSAALILFAIAIARRGS